MFKAIWSCIKRVVSSGTGAPGTLSTSIGTISQWLGHPVVVPGWAWIVVGAVLLFATACRIEWELIEEKDKNRKPRPDISLLDVVKRIRGKDDVFTDSRTIEIVRAFTRIRELAITGAITVFGAPGIQYIPDGDVDAILARVPIPADEWNECSLSLMGFMKQPTCGRVENDDSNNRPFGSGYGYIWFDRKQVDSIWPPRRPKIAWQSTLRRKSDEQIEG